MPSNYTCKECGKVVNISRLDPVQDLCPDCGIVIFAERYERNVAGTTLFSSFGENIGHQIIGEVVLRYYKEQNPDENIILLTPFENYDIENSGIFNGNVNKFFWADISNMVNAPKDKRVIHYRFAREVAALADNGYYPEYKERQEIDWIDTSEKYYILHLRNIHENPEKNVSEYQAEKIFGLFENGKVFIIGNDMPFYELEKPFDFLDLRGKLSLQQISWLCGHENCIATIGKDSGPMHLAAASGGKVVSYGYASERLWTPKAKPGMVKTFGRVGGEFESFISYVKNEFHL